MPVRCVASQDLMEGFPTEHGAMAPQEGSLDPISVYTASVRSSQSQLSTHPSANDAVALGGTVDLSAPTTSAFKYRAFISYSHQDKHSAEWLHKALEGYRIPKSLVGQSGRDGPIPDQVFPIFRDREELASSPDLSVSIRDALAQSAYLIVICSPAAAASRWVNQEIIEFKKLGRRHRIHALIIDGEPSGQQGDTECLPTALRFNVDDSGLMVQEESGEPLAADLRKDGDGKEEAKLKLIAGLLGISFNDLRRRELIAARRRMRISQAIAISMIVLGAGVCVAGWFALNYREESEAKNLPGIVVERRETTLDLTRWQETTDAEFEGAVKKSMATSTNRFVIVRTGKQATEFVHRIGTSSAIAPEVRCEVVCKVVPRHAGEAARMPREWDIVVDISNMALEERKELVFSVLFWNAFQAPRQWVAGFRILHTTELSVFNIEFPQHRRPLPETITYTYVDKEEHPYEREPSASVFTDERGRVAKVVWQVPNPRGDRSYRLKWDWAK